MKLTHNFAEICRMIQIRHSLFALPFAYAGAFLAADGWPGLLTLFLLTLAMISIRAFGMAFSKVADLPYDRQNPRAANWPLVTGQITVWQTWQFAGLMAILCVIACGAMNPLLLALSPVALLICTAYSYTKRITWLCHFLLGLVIALGPLAGWLAVNPSFSLAPFTLALAVLFWIAGFDILYSCQEAAFDAQEGLHSIPVRFGLQGALPVAAFSHALAALLLLMVGAACGLSLSWYVILIITAGLLWREHRALSPTDLSRVRVAFALNGPLALFLLLGILLGVSYA